MKRLFVLALIILLAGFAFVRLLNEDPGYVLISYGHYTVESSLAVALLSFIITLIILLLSLKIFSRLVGKSLSINTWFSQRSNRRSQQKTLQGIIAYLEGNWEHSRRLLSSSAENSTTPFINYLFAAWASNELRDDVGTRELLRKTRESASGIGIAVDIAQAEMQIERGYLERSLATLTRAKASAGKKPYVYKLLEQVYIGLNDWAGLAELLADLSKYKIIDKAELERLTRRCCQERLQLVLANKNGEDARVALLDIWRKQSKSVTRNSELVLTYAQCLIKAGDEAAAENLLREQLKREWTAPLVDLYGIVKGKDSNKQLLQAETWLHERNNDARLLLCLGRLSLRNSLWGKAKEYFETSNKLCASSEACAELGRLLAHMGKHELSNEYYHQGLLMSTHGLPDLPQPNIK